MKRQTGRGWVSNCIALLAFGLLAASCTSTRIAEPVASTSHETIARDQTITTTQAEAAQPPERRVPRVNDYANNQQAAIIRATPDAPISTDTAVIRSGVIYQDQTPAVRPTAPTAPLLPLPQTQLAALENTPSTLETGTEPMAFVDPNSPESLAQQRIDALYPSMPHATCKGGWATPPDRLDAKRETIGHPYYMEMRLRNTPLLPVGHTYIAYGRLSPEGEILNEHVVMLSPVGGYGGAAVAAALPMPGILKPVADDCRIKPHAAYRVSLTAEQFEKLLLRIQKAQKKIPAYALFAYNCNHFASDIAASVGILPPKNIYLPAVKYIYGVIEANEGYNPKKTRQG